MVIKGGHFREDAVMQTVIQSNLQLLDNEIYSLERPFLLNIPEIFHPRL